MMIQDEEGVGSPEFQVLLRKEDLQAYLNMHAQPSGFNYWNRTSVSQRTTYYNLQRGGHDYLFDERHASDTTVHPSRAQQKYSNSKNQ